MNVRLLVDTLKDATIVPAAAVQQSPQIGSFVYVVKDETVDARPVKTGATLKARLVGGVWIRSPRDTRGRLSSRASARRGRLR